MLMGQSSFGMPQQVSVFSRELFSVQQEFSKLTDFFNGMQLRTSHSYISCLMYSQQLHKKF